MLSARFLAFLFCANLALPSFAEAETPTSPTTESDAIAPTSGRDAHLRWPLDLADWNLGAVQPLPVLLRATPEELDKIAAEQPRFGARGANLHRSLPALIEQGDPASRERAREILQRLVTLHDKGDLATVVTRHGIEFAGVAQRQESGGKVYEITPPNPQRPEVLNYRNLASEYAMLYLLDGKPEHAQKARNILLRFAEVMPHWPIYDRDNQPHSQQDEAYLAISAANGIWSVWNPLDFFESLPLLRAYDIIRPTLSAEDQATIEKNIFVHQKSLNDRYPRNRRSYDNLQGYRLPPLALFGKVLNRPDYVHDTVGYLREILSYSYTPDGFWREVTPGYHRQITLRLTGTLPYYLKGYSDPKGYRNPETGTRFDNLDLALMFEPQFSQMEKGLRTLSMPDGTYVTLNDAWPKSDKIDPSIPASTFDEPGLLGIAGISKLGSQGMVSFLQFGGYRGHDHDSALNLVWFAGGREVFSETGYQALPGSNSTREWHSITASHNTVAVNETVDFRTPERLPKSLTIPPFDSQEEPPLPLRAVIPTAAQYVNQGRLLLWQAGSTTAQAMEAEREQAYPGVTSLFRRTVVMVPYGDGTGDGYLVDIFRIRGGRTHDFFLRGGLDAPYTLNADTPLQPAEGKLYKYIDLKKSADIRAPFTVTARYEDGYEVRSRLGAVLGSDGTDLTFLLGEAPAIRRLGNAPFSILRHALSDPKGDNLETCYIWVHEAGRSGKIRSVRAGGKGMDVTVAIERDDRTDLIFSGEKHHSSYDSDGWSFTGRLAFASGTAGQWSGLVFSGGNLKKGAESIALGRPSAHGTILASTRRETGAATHSVLVHLEDVPDLEAIQPQLAHIDFGPWLRMSIPVTGSTREGEMVRVQLAHSPGFDIKENGPVMNYSPGWAFSGTASLLLEGKPAEGKRSSPVSDSK